MFLIGPLPVSDQPALCQENEKVKGIKACGNRGLPDKTVGEILLSAAGLILALEYQDTLWLQDTVCLTKSVPVKPMQAFFIRKYTEATIDPITGSLFQSFPLGGQKRRVEHHAVNTLIRKRQMTSVCLRHTLALRIDVKAGRWRFNACPIVKSSNAVGGIAVDLSTRRMEPQDISDDLTLIVGYNGPVKLDQQ